MYSEVAVETVAQPTNVSRAAELFRYVAVIIAIGVLCGLGGMALGLLLRLVHYIAYGYSFYGGVHHAKLLEAVTVSSPLRRVVSLSACGLVAGCGWWALFRYGSSPVSVRKAITDDRYEMPAWTTIANDLLQIVTIGLGSPLGRDVAPRELGAVFSTLVCKTAKLPPSTTRILIACGAGAGLAADFNVPVGGALFTLEVLPGTFNPTAIVPALATSVLATLVAKIGLGDVRQYFVQPFPVPPSLILWAILIGPLLGLAAHKYVRWTGSTREQAPWDWPIMLWCGAVFPAIGFLAIYFPQLLGNGHGLVQLTFDSGLTIRLALILLGLRLLVTLAALRAGAEGGLLTPGLTIGALLGTIGGYLWSHAFPGTPIGAFAIVGAIAFLATSMKMPLTAVAIGAEFTRMSHDLLIPVLLAVAGSYAVSYICSIERERHVRNNR